MSVFALLWFPVSGLAATVTPFELGYSVRSWSTNDGLSHGDVETLWQDPDGYLWIGTRETLSRFDGFKVTEVSPDPPGFPGLRTLPAGGTGARWWAGADGSVIGTDGGGHWSFDGGLAHSGRTLVTSGGAVLNILPVFRRAPLGGSVQVRELEGDRFVQRAEIGISGNAYVASSTAGSDGTAWWTLDGNPEDTAAVYAYRAGEIQKHALPGGDVPGYLWSGETPMVAGRAGIYKFVGGAWERAVPYSRALEGRVLNVILDVGGNYWVSAEGQGVQICRPDGAIAALTPEMLDLPSVCQAVYRTRDGSIWIGGHSGLYQFFRNAFTLWPASEKIRHHPLSAVDQDGTGTMWFAGPDGVYFLRPGQLVSPVAPGPSRRNTTVRGFWEGEGAWLSFGGGRLHRQTPAGRLLAPGGTLHVHDLAEAGSAVWLAGRSWLQRFEGGRFVAAHPAAAAGQRCLCLAAGAGKVLYAGFRDRGIFRHQDGEWQALGPDATAARIALDPGGGVWAVLGDGRLGRLSGRSWETLPLQALGLPRDFSFLCARDGGFWYAGSKGGVVRLERTAVEAWLGGNHTADLRERRFGLADGLPSEHSEYHARSLFEDARGRIWFATGRGACVYDPEYALTTGGTPAPGPAVSIGDVTVDGTVTRPSGGVLSVPPGAYRLEVRYVAPDLGHPEKVAYRYRLSGYDQRWSTVGNRRVAYYQDLPPGSYRFEVAATGPGEEPGRRTAALSVTVLPQWWETSLFKTALPLSALALLALAVTLRFRHSNESLRQQQDFSRRLIESQERERKRIAGELHDGLGQELLLIKAGSQMVQKKLPGDSPVADRVDGLVDMASQAIASVRRVSSDLRPPTIDRMGLHGALADLIQKTAATYPELEIVFDAGALKEVADPGVQISLYRLVQECLNNTLKHAGASRVAIRATCLLDGSLRILYEDDGKGFSMAGVDRGLGLDHIRERAHNLGGTAALESEPGGGTRVKVTLPPST